MQQVVSLGDVILVTELETEQELKENDNIKTYELKQFPDIDGGILAMDPNTGRVLAMVGGWSFSTVSI